MIIFLHGFMGSPEDMFALAELCGADFTSVALPGHGSLLGETFEESIDALLNILPPGPLDLVGYSMGGRVALALSARYPERCRSVVAISANPGPRSESERVDRLALDRGRAKALVDDPSRFLDQWAELPLFGKQSSDAWRDVLQRRRARADRRAQSWGNALEVLSLGNQPLVAPDPSRFLILGANDSKYMSIGEVWCADGGHCAVVQSSHHAPHLDALSALAPIVCDFLNR